MSYSTASAVLEMTTPLVGWLPGAPRRRIARSPSGELIIPPGWWPPLLDFGASALGSFQGLVRRVKFAAAIKADLGVYAGEDFEAECVDRLMVVELVRPDELEPHRLKEVLDMGGKYVGLAPQRWAAGLGRFRVVDLT